MSGNFYPPEQIYVRVYTPYGETEQQADVYRLSEDGVVYLKVYSPEELQPPHLDADELPLLVPGSLARRSDPSDAIFADNLGDVPMTPLKEYVRVNGHSDLPGDLQDALRIIAPLAADVKSARKGPRA